MKKTPIISIIVPIYNTERYLEDCVESLLNQTTRNIEIILVDDCSEDASFELIKKYSSMDKRIIYSRHKENHGQAVARNTGIDLSIGDYILFVDSDDLLAHNAIEKLTKVVEKKNVDLVRFNATSFNDEDKIEFHESKYNGSKYLKENKLYNDKNRMNFMISFTASPVLHLIKKDIIINYNLRFTKDIIHEDELFNTELYMNINTCLFINHDLYKRRYRKNSTMTNTSQEQKNRSLYSYLKIYNIYKNKLEVETNKINKRFLKYRMNSIYFNLYKNSKNKYEKELNANIYLELINKQIYRFLKLIMMTSNKINI